MGARCAKLNCRRNKSGDKQSKTGKLTGLTMDEVKERLGQATGLSPEKLRIIVEMKQEGCSLKQIREEYQVEIEVLKQFLTDPQEATGDLRETVVGCETWIDKLVDQGKGLYDISQLIGVSERAVLAYTLGTPDVCNTYSKSQPTTTEKTKEPPHPTQMLPKPQHKPTFFYCCSNDSHKLRRVNLLTGAQSCHKVPSYKFKRDCRWSDLPGGVLLITGGDYPAVREVVKVDTLRENAISSQPPMHTARYDQAAVYYSQYLYVLGGTNVSDLSECERYSCVESRWEMLPPLPVAGCCMSAVEVENSLYALGGKTDGGDLDTVQMLSLDSFTWELMQLKLPQEAYYIPCFKTDTQVYLMISATLFTFTPLQVKPIKAFTQGIQCPSSYYSRGTLYGDFGFMIGSLALEF
jgi:hypothetical protein